jgi:hypothetical protein
MTLYYYINSSIYYRQTNIYYQWKPKALLQNRINCSLKKMLSIYKENGTPFTQLILSHLQPNIGPSSMCYTESLNASITTSSISESYMTSTTTMYSLSFKTTRIYHNWIEAVRLSSMRYGSMMSYTTLRVKKMKLKVLSSSRSMLQPIRKSMLPRETWFRRWYFPQSATTWERAWHYNLIINSWEDCS